MPSDELTGEAVGAPAAWATKNPMASRRSRSVAISRTEHFPHSRPAKDAANGQDSCADSRPHTSPTPAQGLERSAQGQSSGRRRLIRRCRETGETPRLLSIACTN